MTYYQFKLAMKNKKTEEVLFIVHRTRGGKPQMMGKQAYENGKVHIHREGWRLATEDQIKAYYSDQIEEAEPEVKKATRAQRSRKKTEAKAEEE